MMIENYRTKCRSQVGRQSENRIVRPCHWGSPDIGKGSFNQYKTWATSESCKEPANRNTCKGVGETSTKNEETEKRDACKVDRGSPKRFTEVRSDDGGETNSE